LEPSRRKDNVSNIELTVVLMNEKNDLGAKAFSDFPEEKHWQHKPLTCCSLLHSSKNFEKSLSKQVIYKIFENFFFKLLSNLCYNLKKLKLQNHEYMQKFACCFLFSLKGFRVKKISTIGLKFWENFFSKHRHVLFSDKTLKGHTIEN